MPQDKASNLDAGEVKRLLVRDGSLAKVAIVAKKVTTTRVGSAVRGSRRVRAVVIVTALAAGAYVLWSPAPLAYDTAYALVWGRQILNGHVPDYTAVGAPTPHPLLTAFGVLSALTGEHAYTLFVLAGCLFWAVLLYAIVRLGDALGSVAGGFAAATSLAASGIFDSLGVTGDKDVPYVALLVGATTLEVRSRRSGVPVLSALGLAGLIRPEAWLLSAVYWLYLTRSASTTRRLVTLAIVAAAPIIWALADVAVTGNPAYSFTHTRGFTVALDRRTGLHGVDWVLGHELPGILTWPVLIGGAATIAWAALRRQRTLLVPSVVAVLAALTFALQGITGLAVSGRLLLALATMLALLFAMGVVTWIQRRGEPRGRPAAVLGMVAVIVTLAALPGRERRLVDIRRSTQVEGRAYHDLRDFMSSSSGARLRLCPKVILPLFAENAGAEIPYVAYSMYHGGADRISISSAGPEGLLLERPESEIARESQFPEAVTHGLVSPPSFMAVGNNTTWAAWVRGC